MGIFLVTTDLDRMGSNYTSIRKKLVALNGMQAQGTVWLVRFEDSADALRDHLQDGLDSNDRLLVVRINSDWAAFNMAPSCRWLREAAQEGH